MPNYDENNKVFYGVISQHSIHPEALDEIYFGDHSKDQNYECWKDEVTRNIQSALSDYARVDEINDVVDFAIDNIEYQNDETDFDFDDGEYHVIKCLDSDLMVIKAPFVTWAPPCSPCVPAAGNLDDAVKRYHPNEEGYVGAGEKSQTLNSGISGMWGNYSVRITYCLGPDFFDDEKCPYPYAPIDEDGVLGDWVYPE
jgi:hypothetical protein